MAIQILGQQRWRWNRLKRETDAEFSIGSQPVEFNNEIEAGTMGTEDTESIVGAVDHGSEVSGEEEPVPPTDPDPAVVVSRGVTPAIRAALVELDTVNLAMEFSQTASLMKSVPNFLHGTVSECHEVGNGGSHGIQRTSKRTRLEIVPSPSTFALVSSWQRREHTQDQAC